MTSSGDGVDDAVNRIVLLSGSVTPRQWLRNSTLIDGNSNVQRSTIPSNICFTLGVLITTPRGQVPVEQLAVGDLVITADNGLQPIRWIGSRDVTRTKMQAAPQAQPVRIKKGTFGPYLPAQDIWVSQPHQMLLETDDAQRLFNCESVLTPAKAMVNDDTILLDANRSDVQYIHLMSDEHQVVFVDGIPSKSFYPNPGSLLSLSEIDRRLVFDLKPNLESHPMSYGPTARPTVAFHQAQMLAA